jgi:hypothetical protein
MLTNAQISAFRKYSADENKHVARRLHSIDLLAADAGLYCLKKTEQFYQEGKNIRARREVIHLLRLLLKSPSPETKRVHTAGIENRLRFIQTGISLDGWGLWKPVSESKTKQADQQASSLADDLETFLASHGYEEKI